MDYYFSGGRGNGFSARLAGRGLHGHNAAHAGWRRGGGEDDGMGRQRPAEPLDEVQEQPRIPVR